MILANGPYIAQKAFERRAESKFAEMEVGHKVVDVRPKRAVEVRLIGIILWEPSAVLAMYGLLVNGDGHACLELGTAELVVHLAPLTVHYAQSSSRLRIHLHERIGVELATVRNLANLRMEERIDAGLPGCTEAPRSKEADHRRTGRT